ncbi:hypothetical protein [Spiroplasma ixodetis]|uniref:Transmembrane protein n=1 Tax=Spiroplasma ixodetis TaxID=2141 RepID=A0ABN7BXI2_9MOLU
MENMESYDLNKELKIYYDNSKNDREFSKTYTGDGKISIPIVRIIEAAGMGSGVGVVAGAIVGSAVPGAGTVIGAAGSGVIGATIGTATSWLTFGDYINNKNQESKDFYINLKEVNPFDYKKIEILY